MSEEVVVTQTAVLDPTIAEIQSAILMGMGAVLGFLIVDKLASAISERRK